MLHSCELFVAVQQRVGDALEIKAAGPKTKAPIVNARSKCRVNPNDSTPKSGTSEPINHMQ